ncbi:MAG: rod shape-determining protein MreC [Steroidobacteraceae bacterium]|nr:rod shape-determining protein MreC [Steroidobacteraceae bacterium]
MAAFATGATRSLPQRGPAAGLRFFIYALLALTLMVLDQRGGWLERVRYGLQAAAYPLQLAMNSPSAAWNWTRRTFEARADLQEENARLRESNRLLRLANMRQAALEQENAQLRGLRERLPAVAQRWLPGEVIGTESTTLRQRITVDRGAANGVFKGQAVIANGGLLGQTLRVGPWSTEVILVTDPEHAVPVQVTRNGLRTLAVGSGDPDTLTLPYLPIQSDIKDGDLLVTSGLGGVFPQGYPVARVVQVRRDGNSPLAQVRATPLAAIERDRIVSFLWFDAAHPAAPAPPASAASGGDPSVQPMRVAAPPPPVPLPAIAAPPVPAGTASPPAATAAAGGATASADPSTPAAPAAAAPVPAAAAPAAAAPAATVPAPTPAPASTPAGATPRPSATSREEAR